ncbi:MAG TPA: nucleotidyltransferase domain-containing protein, partial [Acetobacteraceae bacterium]
MEAYIRGKVASGDYSDATDVIQAALRLMLTGETGSRPAPEKHEIVAALKALEPELRGRGVASVALFGSVVQGQARPDSDVDVLIALDPT